MSVDKIIVVGGGFFGMYIACYLAEEGNKVLLLEQEEDFMQRASYNNQARVHNGYHYPRNLLTAIRSSISFPKFKEEFSNCIYDTFDNYYAVGKLLGKVTAKQFKNFCTRVGIPYEEAPSYIYKLTNPKLIEAVFSTQECTFDSVKLKNTMKDRLDSLGVEYRLQNSAKKILKEKKKLTLEIKDLQNNHIYTESADQIFNCTYALLNQIISDSDINIIPLKHEMVEMCLINVPEELSNVGITVMCGPFFSIMPFPSLRHVHSFSHVRYTPHYEWYDKDKKYKNYARENLDSSWKKMQLDAKRYMPVLEKCVYTKSLWEIKTVLPKSEVSDSRPILFKQNFNGIQGFHCIMGGKIDNVYDIVDILRKK